MTPSVLLFFAFCFFSILCPSLQGHGIRYTARVHAPVAENSAKKRPFVKQKESKQYSLTCSGARRSGCSEAAADGLHTDRQIAAGVPLDGIVVVRVERLQKTSTDNIGERVPTQAQCGLVLASDEGYNQ